MIAAAMPGTIISTAIGVYGTAGDVVSISTGIL